MMGKLSTVCLQAFFLLFTVHAFANPQIDLVQSEIQKAEEVLAQLLVADQKTHDFFKELADQMGIDYKKFEYSKEYQDLQAAIDTAKGWLEAQQNPQVAFGSQDITEIRTELSRAMITAEQIVLEDKKELEPALVADMNEVLQELDELDLRNQTT